MTDAIPSFVLDDPNPLSLRDWVARNPARATEAISELLALASQPSIDVAHLAHQREWSLDTFGPGKRTLGVLNHIRKELKEIEDDPGDLMEWVDVIILAFDGAWRHGWEPKQIIAAIKSKQALNEARHWPDWRLASPDEPIEHNHAEPEEPEREMSSWWVSWYEPGSGNTAFELHSPWWMSGRTAEGLAIYCAAVRAPSFAAAEQAVVSSYDEAPDAIEFRFVEQMPSTWSPFTGRFPKSGWMLWDGDNTCACPAHVAATT